MACVRGFDFAKGRQGLTVRAALRVRAFFESSMIIALFALAVLMIVGGVASVVQGFPFVRLESGMAMTVAGATTASAGAVVLGLATVASHLRGLGRRLGEVRAAMPPVESLAARPPEPEVSEPAFAMPALGERPMRQRPSLGGPESREFGMGGMAMGGLGLGAAGLGAQALAAAEPDQAKFGAGPHGRGPEPTFVLPPDIDLPAPPPPETVEPLLPDLLPPLDAQAPSAEVRPLAPEPTFAETSSAEISPAEPRSDEPESVAAQAAPPEDRRAMALFDTGTDAPGEPVRLYPTLDTMADITPEPARAPETPAVEDKPEIVGTYASGGNTYVMYANGSIEAETPRGRFSFDSLDELKAFVEAGGETDARGAA